MKDRGTKGCKGRESQTPKNIKVNTQAADDDLVASMVKDSAGVSDAEVETAVNKINPDVNSMESRG